MIKRLFAGPDPAQHAEIFVGARIALIVAQEIAVLALLGVVASGDDMNGNAPAGELIEGRELARGKPSGP